MSLAVLAGGLVLTILVPLGLHLLVTAFVSRRSLTTFWVDERRERFVAHALHTQTYWVILIAWSAARVVTPFRGGPPYPTAVSLGFVAFALVAAAAILLLDRPRVVLTPAGLTVQRLRHRTFHTWDELEFHEPPAPLRTPSVIAFRVRSATTPQFLHIPVARLDSREPFLTAALRNYAEHPGHRPAIGTRDELDRLRAEAEAAAVA